MKKLEDKQSVKLFATHEWVAIFVSLLAFLTSLTSLYVQFFHQNHEVAVNPIQFVRDYDQVESWRTTFVSANIELSIGNLGNTDQFLTFAKFTCELDLDGKPISLKEVYATDLKTHTIPIGQRKLISLDFVQVEFGDEVTLGRLAFEEKFNTTPADEKCLPSLTLRFIGADARFVDVDIPLFLDGIPTALSNIVKYKQDRYGGAAEYYDNESPATTVKVKNGNTSNAYAIGHPL